MLKKEEIFVDIQNNSEYDKVIKLLRSFGQRLEMIGWEHMRCAHFYENHWCVPQRSYIEKLKTKVSLQELKNILAFDYLKKGDVIIFSGGTAGLLWIAEFERFVHNRGVNLPLSIKTKRHNSLHKESRYQHSSSGEIYGSFVRFATDGEKRVLGNNEWPVSKKDQLIELLNDAYKSLSNNYTLDTMPVRNALSSAMDYITAMPDITTNDVAKIERLHDYLIEAYNIHPSLKQLSEAREVISKLSKYE